MSSFWTVEAEQEGLVRGHLHLLGEDTGVHLLDLDMMDHLLQLRTQPHPVLVTPAATHPWHVVEQLPVAVGGDIVPHPQQHRFHKGHLVGNIV